jgi:protein farnesyltransferase/geranylgeranyltransferase type-1 subunit alpha
MSGKSSGSPEWADVVPIEQTDTHLPNPLAAIAYGPEYSECMSYLRAVMAANEFSSRVLELTEDLIDMNPAHYTVWLYRAQCLFALDSDLQEELEWVNETALRFQKNYQIWHHRFLILGKIKEKAEAQQGQEGQDEFNLEQIVDGEREFVKQMFELDAKNYHVWSYRQWLVKTFDLWEKGELEFTEEMLSSDVRNNSVWNHRWYVVNGREGVAGVTDQAIRKRETDFALKAIAQAPQNQSPWNYLRGIAKQSGIALSELKACAEEYASLDKPKAVRSSFALDLLAEILVEEKQKERAGKALDLLATTYDPVRKNYWEYRKGLLGLSTASTAVAA